MHIVWKLITVFVVVVAGCAAGAYLWIDGQLKTPRQHEAGSTVIEIPDGASTDLTLKILAEKGVIGETLPLKLYIKYKHAGPFIKAGYYTFPSPVSPLTVLEKLEAGQQGANRLTIIEGWTKWDVASAIAAHTPFHITRDKALQLLNDPKLVKDIDPGATSLEGYVFPDTYFFGTSTTAKELIERSVGRFKEIWKKEIAEKAKKLGINCHETVTVASIVETEGKLAGERPMVASVVYNRLVRKIPLAMDSTIVYASKLAGAWKNDGKVYMSDIERKSPYNTRKNAGLPPGPVGCPGLASLRAAVSPASTNYIYYVRNPDRNDGAHNFYVNAADFEVGVQALRKWEARRDAAAKGKGK